MKKTYKDLINELKKGSPDTSLNQIAAGFKKVNWKPNTTNLDLGGGKFEKSTEYLLNEHAVTNLIVDPYNRSASHNKEAMKQADERAITTTIFNVLNVIPEEKERIKLLKRAKRKHTKNIYITVYEKDGDGAGHETTKGWQNSMKLKAYLPEVQKVYSGAKIAKQMIIVSL